MLHPNSGSRRNILVVDDEPEIVACVCEFLAGRGFNVLGLSNSLEARLFKSSMERCSTTSGN